MKKKLLLVSYVLVSSVLLSLSLMKKTELCDVQLENIEALTAPVDGPEIQCLGSVVAKCIKACPGCGTVWGVPGVNGPATDVRGTCGKCGFQFSL